MDDMEISYTKCHVLNLYQKITEEERMVDTKNLFFGTSIATCIMVIKKNKADNRRLLLVSRCLEMRLIRLLQKSRWANEKRKA